MWPADVGLGHPVLATHLVPLVGGNVAEQVQRDAKALAVGALALISDEGIHLVACRLTDIGVGTSVAQQKRAQALLRINLRQADGEAEQGFAALFRLLT